MKAIQTKDKSTVLEGLNAKQEQAVTFGAGPLLIIAGAGTGKTTVLTRRIAWLIEQGLAKPDEILALTFTEKAAAEMEERVDMIMPLGYADMTIATFHAFAQRILTDYALDIGLPGDFKILTDTKAWILMRERIYEFNLDYYRPKGNPSKFIYALLKHFDRAKREGISPEDYLKYAEELNLKLDQPEIRKKAKRKLKLETPVEEIDRTEAARILEVANAYDQYQKLLLDNCYLDFGDLINYTIKLLKTRNKILNFYQQKYKYILVDEFQDTDLAQYELVKLLASPQNNITMVGDDDQSIYKFRGASISNILMFKDDYPSADEITLTDNYRSAQNILDLSYKFIQQNNPERLEARLNISKKLVSHKPEPSVIQVIHTQIVHDEASEVAKKIQELSEQGVSLNDIAILARANDHLDPFILELSRLGIPYIFVASRGLYRKPLILDIFAYLRLLTNFHLNEFMFRVLHLPKFRIDHGDLVRLSHEAYKKTLSLYEIIKQHENYVKLKDESKEKLRHFIEIMDRHCFFMSETPISQFFVQVIDDLGIKDMLVEDSVENADRRNVLQQFYRKVQDFESESTEKHLVSFLANIDLELQAGDQGTLVASADVGPEAVKVMTVHSSKGLEFTSVFVVNMVDQRFPSRDRKELIDLPEALVKEILPDGDAHLMEERRLFYVAATRAKQHLYFTWSDDYGGSVRKKPSIFLVEVGMEQEEKSMATGEVFFTKQQSLPIPKLRYVHPIPDAFDFSQVSSFKKCPLEYKFRYMYKLPMPGAAPLSFGITMHNTLKKFMQNVQQMNAAKQVDLFGQKLDHIQVPKKDMLMKFYQDSWVDDWYESKVRKESYRADGIRYLSEFYDLYLKKASIPKYLEQPFRLKLGAYKFKGRIDRADLNEDGTIDIIDYKTGEPRVKLEQVDKDQLLIYQWAAQECFGEKVRSMYYLYFKSPEAPLQFIGSVEEIQKLKEKMLVTIEEIVETIKNDSFLHKDKEKSHDCKYRHMEPEL